MSKRFLTGVCIGLCLSMGLHAQFSDKDLFIAYLHSDMPAWDRYLHSERWDTLSLKEQLRYINYEYGDVATAIDAKQPDAKEHLEAFKAHIDALERILPEATYKTYLSSYCAYRAKLSTLEFVKQGLKAKNLAMEAAQSDPTNPLALTLVGCIDFYAPAIVGGNKERALQTFKQTKRLLELSGDTINNWNYASVEMQLAMCLAKTGHKEEAIALCEQLLQKYPGFVFIRDEYYPTLLPRR